jgi:hypothetical protein
MQNACRSKKSTTVPLHAQIYGGGEGVLPRIPGFETRGKRVVNHHGRYIPGKVPFRTHETGWLVQTSETVLTLFIGIILLLPRIEQRFFRHL